MDDVLVKILIGLSIGLLGFFLRDVYNYLKRKFVKSNKPRVILEYEVTASGAHGSNPRLYEFKSKLLIQNIDTEPIYNLRVVRNLNGTLNDIFKENHLSPNEKKEIRNEIEIPFGEIGADYESARQVIPDNFKTPNYVLHFEDTNGHKFKQKVVFK